MADTVDSNHAALIEVLSLTRQEYENGTVIYRNHLGERHRVHGPAEVWPDGFCAWYQNGRLHRVGGAAVIYPNWEERWYQNDQLHRTDGAAVIYNSGERHWYQNGTLHRVDGPAIVYSDGDQRWFLNGEEVSEEKFNQCIADGGYNDT